MSRPTVFDAVRFERDQLDAREAEGLRRKGWKHTCNVPGSYWLWEKTLRDGRTVLVEQKLAVGIQEAADFLGAEKESA